MLSPSWYDSAKLRGEGDDRMAYWARRMVAVVDAGESGLHVTPAEYHELRNLMTDYRPSLQMLGVLGPPLDSIPVYVDA